MLACPSNGPRTHLNGPRLSLTLCIMIEGIIINACPKQIGDEQSNSILLVLSGVHAWVCPCTNEKFQPGLDCNAFKPLPCYTGSS